jgi:hypothetical protein
LSLVRLRLRLRLRVPVLWVLWVRRRTGHDRALRLGRSPAAVLAA